MSKVDMRLFLSSLLWFSPIVSAEEAIGVGKLIVDMTIPQVIALKGKPLSVAKQADYVTEVYKYSDIVASFSGEYLVGIYSENEHTCTLQQVCPGASLESAKTAYGEAYEKSKGVLEFYPEYANTCWYRVHTNGSLIDAIEVVCQP